MAAKAKQKLVQQLDGLKLEKNYTDKMLEYFKTTHDIKRLTMHLNLFDRKTARDSVKNLSSMNSEQIKTAKKLIYIEGRTPKQQLYPDYIYPLALLKGKQMENLLDLVFIPNSKKQFSERALCRLAMRL